MNAEERLKNIKELYYLSKLRIFLINLELADFKSSLHNIISITCQNSLNLSDKIIRELCNPIKLSNNVIFKVSTKELESGYLGLILEDESENKVLNLNTGLVEDEITL